MKKYIIPILAALAALASCNVEDDPIINPEDNTEVITSNAEPTAETLDGTVAFLGNISDRDYFASKSKGESPIESADVIFTDTENFLANAETFRNAYNTGRIIAVVYPSMAKINPQVVKNGWTAAVSQPSYMMCFSALGNFALDAPDQALAIYGSILEEKLESGDLEDVYVEPGVNYEDNEFSDVKYFIEPFFKWAYRVLNFTSAPTNAGMSKVSSVSLEHVKTIPINLFLHSCSKFSSDDRIKGNYQVSARYTYTPYFATDATGTTADYYDVTAAYTSHTGLVFKGNDKENRHGGIYVHYTGAFLRNFKVWTAVLNSNYKTEFLASAMPLPATTVTATNYSDTHSWKIGGNVTGGIGKDNGTVADATKKELKATFSFEVGESSTVSYSLSDLAINNEHANGNLPSNFENIDYYGDCFEVQMPGGGEPMKLESMKLGTNTGDYAAWMFKCENLPSSGGDNGFNRDATYVSSSTVDFNAHWVWRVPDTKSGSNESIGYLCTVINPTLGAVKNGYCVKYKSLSFDLGYYGFAAQLLAPNRLSFGIVNVVNNTTDAVLSDIVATSDKYEYTCGSSSFNPDANWKQSMPTGNYTITLNKIDTDGTVTKYVSTRPVNITMSSGESDFVNINFPHNFKVVE